MPETEIKKQKLVSLVKETGRSKEDIIEFLHELGLEKITVNSTIEADMVAKVYERFKKDIENKQKHIRKVMKFTEQNTGVTFTEAVEKKKKDEEERLKREEDQRIKRTLEEERKRKEEEIKKQQEQAFKDREEALKAKIESDRKKKEELDRILELQKAKEEKKRLKQEKLEKEKREKEKKEKEEKEKVLGVRITELPKPTEEQKEKDRKKAKAIERQREEKKEKKEVEKASQEKLFEGKNEEIISKKPIKEEKPAELPKDIDKKTEEVNIEISDAKHIKETEIPKTEIKKDVTSEAQAESANKKSDTMKVHETGKVQHKGDYKPFDKHKQSSKQHSDKQGKSHQDKTGKPHYEKTGKPHFDKSGKPHFDKSGKPHHERTDRPPFDKSKPRFDKTGNPILDSKSKTFSKNRPGKPRNEKITIKDKKEEREKNNLKDFSPSPPVAAGQKVVKIQNDFPNKRKKTKADFDFERKKKAKIAKEKARNISKEEIDDAIRETMAKMGEEAGASTRAIARKKKKKERLEQEKIQQDIDALRANVINVTEYLSTVDLANLMKIEASEIIKKCFLLGNMITINQRLDKDLIQIIADEFGFKIEFQKEYNENSLDDESDAEETLKPRPPVVTVMGHVDHGKTSLLDYIRKANVVAGEAGGITQHIGAYKVKVGNGKEIAFLDTPGHEAFTAMRARGGQAADIVVLVVAADDSVMPQTVEAINHALAANVPIVVAINKVDKPDSNSERIRQQLAEKNILVEEWGGNYQSVEISAKFGRNIDILLEKILLQAELLELKANPDRATRGVVLEAKLDKGRGVSATVLVQKGTLKVGSNFVAGLFSGKVRAMFDERDKRIESAGPSTPVMVSGFDGMPQAGDVFIELESESMVREIALKRQQLKREQDFRQVKRTTLDDISKQIKEGIQVDLNIIIKADTDGSAEAISDSLMKLSTNEAKVNVIHNALGQITESDILLAEASGAIVIGFNVRPNLNARKIAEKNSIDIRLHNIIYKIIDEVKLALEGMLEPELKEEVTCTIEVRQVFKVPKIGNIAGCYVQDGKISRNTKVRLLREGFVIFEGGISSLKRIKDDVREVGQGYECGIGLENFNDIKPGDIIEGFKIVETKRTLVFENN